VAFPCALPPCLDHPDGRFLTEGYAATDQHQDRQDAHCILHTLSNFPEFGFDSVQFRTQAL